MSISEVLLRVVLSFFVLFVLARIMGRKEISQMTFFNFVSAIAIGSIAASLSVNSILSIRNGIIALIGWTVITITLGYLDIKSKPARKLLRGQPMIVVRDGKVMENELRKSRLDIDSLNALLREKSIFSMKDVDYAIFETDGKLSVMKKELKQNATKGDTHSMLVSSNIYPIPTEIISDGKINYPNLEKLHLEEEWVFQQLKQKNVDDISSVFYGEIQKDGSLYIDQKDDLLQ